MKIIGRKRSLYLAEIDINEIAILMGFEHLYDKKWRDYLCSMGIRESCGEPVEPHRMEGVVIDLKKYAKRVHDIESRQKDAEKAISALRGLADALETAWPVLKLEKEGESE